VAWSGGEVGRRQDGVEQPGRGEQRRVGELRPRQVVRRVGVLPSVQVVELPPELLSEPVGRWHLEAARAHRLQAQLDRLDAAFAVGQAVHLAGAHR
jgi:hypothetical protein